MSSVVARKTFTDQELDAELVRRRSNPPTSLELFPDEYRGEWRTVAELQAEVDEMPADYPDREWCEWELALARRQAAVTGRSRFFRVVKTLTH